MAKESLYIVTLTRPTRKGGWVTETVTETNADKALKRIRAMRKRGWKIVTH